MEQILALTVVAELPHDLGMHDTAVFAFEEGTPWTGWDAESMAGMVGYTKGPVEGRVPTFRLTFRRMKTRTRLPLYAADKAFGKWVTPLLTRRQRIRRRIGMSLARIIGLREMVTVVGITAFLPARLVPDPTEEWVEIRVGKALDVLNEFLIALGIEAQDARVGPVTRSDLPPSVPLIAEEQPVPAGKRIGTNWLVSLHPWRPNAHGGLRNPDVLMEAATLFRAATRNTMVGFRLELSHLARRDALAGRYSASIVSSATSIEILFSTLAREMGPIRGWSQSKIDGALDSGFKICCLARPEALRSPNRH